MKIERDSWRMIEIIIRRYPDKKREYEEYISDIMSSTQSDEYHGSSDNYSKPQSVTEAKALKMTSDYADKIKREIQAVEFVYYGLKPEEKELIKKRYWSNPDHKVSFEKIVGVNYSVTQMRRIVRKTILQVGRYLGEIK